MDSVWNGYVPASPSYGAGVDGYPFGLVVTLSSNQPLREIRYYSAPGETSLPTRCGIFDVATKTIISGTDNTSPTWSGTVGSGWVSCAYDGSITLDTRADGYCVAILWPSGYKGYREVAFPVTNGSLTAPLADANGLANAPFGTYWSYPTQSGVGHNGNGYDWFVDVGVGAVPFSPSYVSTESGSSVQDWEVDTPLNQPPTLNTGTGIRILTPDSPDTAYPPSFLYTLPVNNGFHDASYGNGLDTILEAGLHNTYNCTVIEPSFGISPWYADNPDNTGAQLDTFMQNLAEWTATSTFAHGGEKHYLLGFSKSGIGGQSLQFRHPDLFYKTASWDFPAMMTDYDGTDATYGSQVGGDPADSYGTSSNFTSNYELSPANLAAWISGKDFTTTNRLWVGGYYAFQADVDAYKPVLDSLGILYDGSWASNDSSHAWHTDWVSAAMASMYGTAPTETSGATMSAGII